ncbi:hypothetical protein ADH66_01235 [Acutalibacter muris]|uniref:Uncharacterized protein n=1 Tax=Acutalibacter muris TaxID=1796620 RepID=A0ABM6L213_9FIRM|nr:hypothetical protein [Acutalibacter muris]ARE60611.1 hypothetical protein A4V00_19575 [Hungateiclostridiaceae bacterium KB18]ASB39397.1 hypothetical protein ADH66_01235 [Acutalibacter muris]
MEWLRLIKDHIAASISVELEDLSPFDRRSGSMRCSGRIMSVFRMSIQLLVYFSVKNCYPNIYSIFACPLILRRWISLLPFLALRRETY